MHVNEAVKYDDKESINVAIQEGFDINEKDRFYKTPLMMACLEGNLEVAQMLIDNGYGKFVNVMAYTKSSVKKII